MTTRNIVSQGLLAATYVVLLIVFNGLSFGVIQFRVAEVLLVLVLINKRHAVGLLVGTFIGNLLFSPIALDWIIGTSASVIALWLMIKTKEERMAFLWPAIVNGVIIGLQLTYIYGIETPLIMNIGSVFIGEFVVTFVVWLFLLPWLKNNKALMRLL